MRGRERRPASGLRKLLTFVAILFVGLALTYMLRGLWAWIEVRMGLEAIEGGKPALWCYPLVWFVLAILFWPRRR